MKTLICPRCGLPGGKEWRQCPEYGGKAVCAECCYKSCRHWQNDRCIWHKEHPAQNYADELTKIERRIAQKKKQIEHFYNRNQPWVAEKIEHELLGLNREKRALVEKQRSLHGENI